MGLLGRVFRSRSAAQFRELVEAQFREGKDLRQLVWEDDDTQEFTIFDTPTVGTVIDVQEEFEGWKKDGNFDATREFLTELIEAGATTAGGFVAMAIAADMESAPDVLAPGLRLALVWVENGEQTVMTEEALAERKLTFDEARALAAEEALDGDDVFDQLEESVRFFAPHASVGSVLCALPKLKFPECEGDPVILLVENEELYVFGSRDAEAIASATNVVAERLATKSEETLGLCFVVRGGTLTPWLPPRELGPQRLIFAALRRAGLENAYATQKKKLDDLSPLFTASFTVTRQQDLPLMSMASWATGVNALLPRADLVAVSLSLGDHRVIPFGVALEKFPELLQRVPRLWPPRYAVSKIPSAEALTAIGQLTPDLSTCFDVEDETILVPAAHLLNRESFARECIAVLRALGVDNAEYSEEGFGVRYEVAPPPGMTLEPGTRPMMQIGFATPHKRFSHLPDADRRTVLLAYFADMTKSLRALHGEPSSREALMPLLQPAMQRWRGPLQQELQAPAGITVVQPKLATRDFCPGLMLSFVIDTEQTVQFVTEQAGATLAGSPESLFELAMANLRRTTTQGPVQVKPGLYESPMHDEYDATRLLLGERIIDLDVKGAPVAFVPNRATLLITGSEDDANLVECFARVRMALKGDSRPVTLTPLILGVDGWMPWLPPAGRDARGPLAALAREALENELRASAELLQARFPTHTLATLALKDGAASPQVLASFDASKPALLPRADQVSRAGAELESWKVFAQTHASRLEPVAETGGDWYRFTP